MTDEAKRILARQWSENTAPWTVQAIAEWFEKYLGCGAGEYLTVQYAAKRLEGLEMLSARTWAENETFRKWRGYGLDGKA